MNIQLRIDIQSYWHAGTGRTSGRHVDSLVEKDNAGIPLLNGRHLKGLLRDAVASAAHWGWFEELDLPVTTQELEDWLFGTRNENDDDDSSRFTTVAGLVFISNAELPEVDQIIINDAQLKPGLYRNIFSTAINEATGTAKDRSLRGAEVVIPLTLFAEISFEADKKTELAVFKVLEKSLSLIDHVGGMRNRGLGRATLTMTEQGGKAA
ncbi:RAMP superfamily CRISPR-associated protein [Neptunomonas sp.]|uniref:RAMP superfamily CRISPR-associated protein n=1 Tax=Neptunomonas sp. TaxID=1971898 RepID=UPI003562E2B3